jgi:hypothetical protein
MPKIKITNCTVETGGGVKALRKRHNQNISYYVSEKTLEQSDDQILDYFFRRWTLIPSKTSLYFRSTTSSKLTRL